VVARAMLCAMAFTAAFTSPWSARPRQSAALMTLAATEQDWSTEWIAPLPLGVSRLVHRRDGWSDGAAALVSGEAIICVPNLVTESERARLISASTTLAKKKMLLSTATEVVSQILPAATKPGSRITKRMKQAVRMHVPATFAASEVALCDTILLRVLGFVERELPYLATHLFASAALCELHAQGALEYAENEPAINVYYKGGCFNKHRDEYSLTVLIPLSSPEDGAFAGGGTGFWPPEGRQRADGAPSMVLAPPAGTAMLYSGSVLHAGMPVTQGTRVVLVASFARRGSNVGLRPETRELR